MNREKSVYLSLALALIAGASVLLIKLHTNQKLGLPGVKTSPIPESVRLQVNLPERVLDYTSEEEDVGAVVKGALPADTSFGQRRYTATDGFAAQLNVVLMGGDRTSLHKPQICLRGSGWRIDKTDPETINLSAPGTPELKVMRLTLSPEKAGDFQGAHALYVYWFVADQAQTRSHWERMWWMFTHLLRTGTLQRWAYVNCFTVCPPGQEDAAFARLKQLIAAAAPHFHTGVAAANAGAAAGGTASTQKNL